jgi:hypothetical protein
LSQCWRHSYAAWSKTTASGSDPPAYPASAEIAAPVPLPAGSTSYTAVGIHAGTDYCFKVGAVTALGTAAPATKWSNVACAVG